MIASHALVDGLRIIRMVYIPDALYASWLATANPKARCYLPIEERPRPPFDSATEALVESLAVAMDGTKAIRSWAVRAKTPEEMRKVWTALEFLERFTPGELSFIEAEARTNETVASIYRASLAAQEIVSDDPRTIAGMGYLVALGLLSPARRDEILSGSSPSL